MRGTKYECFERLVSGEVLCDEPNHKLNHHFVKTENSMLRLRLNTLTHLLKMTFRYATFLVRFYIKAMPLSSEFCHYLFWLI